MIISIRRTGGYAGLEQSLGRIDTATMDASSERRVRERVDRLARKRAADAIGADMFRFEVDVVEDGGRRRTITLPDESGTGEPPSELRDLLGST